MRFRTFCRAAVVLGSAATPLTAQEEPPQGWAYTGELTTVLTRGNSAALTFGLGSTLEYRRGPDFLKLEAGAIRTESTLTTRRAVGSATDFDIITEENTAKTAESYFARSRYERSVSERLFLFGGADWLRNTFAGIDSRFLLAAGAGNTWTDTDRSRFKTNYAVTYTFQSDVVENPDVATRFGGLRAGWEYWRQVTANSVFESVLVSDLNLNETDDVRLDFTNALTVSMSSALALKPSLQLLWRNLPALTEVELFSPGGAPLGSTVTTPLETTDLVFRLALVVNL